MNCEKCKWYRTTYTMPVPYAYSNGVWVIVARCLLGGCDGSQYEPREEDKQNE